MRLEVLRKGKEITLAKNARIADSALKRFKGLMLEKREKFDYALVFEMPTENRYGASIHMMFMRFPIDVLFLNSEKRIVDLVQGLRPWVLNYTPKKPAKFIIEIPAGSGEKFKLKLGEKVCFS